MQATRDTPADDLTTLTHRSVLACGPESSIAEELYLALRRIQQAWCLLNFYAWGTVMTRLQRAKVRAGSFRRLQVRC